MKCKTNDVMDRATFDAAMRDLMPPEAPDHWLTYAEVAASAGCSDEAARNKLARGVRAGALHPMSRRLSRCIAQVYDPVEVLAWWKKVGGK